MKQDFLVLIGMPGWQTIATLLFVVIYFSNVFFAMKKTKKEIMHSQELPFHEN